jgi:hypothetical protein
MATAVLTELQRFGLDTEEWMTTGYRILSSKTGYPEPLQKLESCYDEIRRACLWPLLDVKSTRRLTRTMMQVLPVFIALRMRLCECYYQILQDSASVKFLHAQPLQERATPYWQSALDLPERSQQKAKKSMLCFLLARERMLQTIQITPTERLYYFERRPAIELFAKSARVELLLLYFWESNAKTPASLEVFCGMVDHLDVIIKDYARTVKGILHEWDIITDLITMRAIEEHEQTVKLTGQLPEGKSVEEFLHELDSKA